jgi:hypothetical protein
MRNILQSVMLGLIGSALAAVIALYVGAEEITGWLVALGVGILAILVSQLVTKRTSRERRYLKETPRQLHDLLNTTTGLEARRLIQPRLGRWLRVSGVVHDVSEIGRQPMVHLIDESVEGPIPTPLVMLLFPRSAREDLRLLKRGQRLVAQGRLSSVEQTRRCPEAGGDDRH